MEGKHNPLCIIKKNFGKVLGNLWLGTQDLDWLKGCIDKAILANTSGEFFKHHRDGYKALLSNAPIFMTNF